MLNAGQSGKPRWKPCLCLLGLSVLVLLAAGCASVRQHGFGPLYDATPNAHGQTGFQAAGPFVEQRRAEDGSRFRAVRPFWSLIKVGRQDRAVTDVLWPIGMFKTRQGELDWRLFPAFGHDFDVERTQSRHRWSVFPLLFGGRSVAGHPYFALFPLGGWLYEFLGYDRIRFVLFPLWSQSAKGKNQTTSILWPIYSRTQGGILDRWRIWPFYGYSHTPQRWTKRFVLWPFWTSVVYHYPNQSGSGFILFPLYGQVDVGERHSRMLLPPFFKLEWSAEGHRAVHAPWPFFQYAHAENEKRLYVFPLAGHRRIGSDQGWFVLWPVASGRKTVRPHTVLTQFRILPVWQHERVRTKAAADGANTQTISRYFRVWPLWLYRREGDVTLMRAPALWPLKRTPAVERNWAPIWSLYRRETVGSRTETELLWGWLRRVVDQDERRFSLFPLIQSRRDQNDDQRSWQFLYGLLGYRREGLQREYQILYFLRMKRQAGSVADAQQTEGTQ